MRFDDGPGAEPYKSGILLMIGKIVPALRAVFEGVNGARIRSETAIAYPRPSVRPPRRLTSTSAIRRPSPVFSYPIAKTKAPKISHTVLLMKPESVHFRASVGNLNAGSARCTGENTSPNT